MTRSSTGQDLPVRISIRGTLGIPIVALALLSAGVLAACGGGGSSTPGAAATASASSSASPSGSDTTGRRNSLFADPKVSQCLSAAGITVPTFSARPRPSGSGTFARPSFTGSRPSGSARPSGGFGGGFGGTSAQNTQIQQALKACGIAIPSFSRQPAAVGSPPAA